MIENPANSPNTTTSHVAEQVLEGLTNAPVIRDILYITEHLEALHNAHYTALTQGTKELIDKHSEIKKGVLNHYRILLSTLFGWDENLSDDILAKVCDVTELYGLLPKLTGQYTNPAPCDLDQLPLSYRSQTLIQIVNIIASMNINTAARDRMLATAHALIKFNRTQTKVAVNELLEGPNSIDNIFPNICAGSTFDFDCMFEQINEPHKKILKTITNSFFSHPVCNHLTKFSFLKHFALTRSAGLKESIKSWLQKNMYDDNSADGLTNILIDPSQSNTEIPQQLLWMKGITLSEHVIQDQLRVFIESIKKYIKIQLQIFDKKSLKSYVMSNQNNNNAIQDWICSLVPDIDRNNALASIEQKKQFEPENEAFYSHIYDSAINIPLTGKIPDYTTLANQPEVNYDVSTRIFSTIVNASNAHRDYSEIFEIPGDDVSLSGWAEIPEGVNLENIRIDDSSTFYEAVSKIIVKFGKQIGSSDDELLQTKRAYAIYMAAIGKQSTYEHVSQVDEEKELLRKLDIIKIALNEYVSTSSNAIDLCARSFSNNPYIDQFYRTYELCKQPPEKDLNPTAVKYISDDLQHPELFNELEIIFASLCAPSCNKNMESVKATIALSSTLSTGANTISQSTNQLNEALKMLPECYDFKEKTFDTSKFTKKAADLMLGAKEVETFTDNVTNKIPNSIETYLVYLFSSIVFFSVATPVAIVLFEAGTFTLFQACIAGLLAGSTILVLSMQANNYFKQHSQLDTSLNEARKSVGFLSTSQKASPRPTSITHPHTISPEILSR
tara:strand:- start:2170 stop:4521 length:2352 start_codon:yes stop_codon:yes gene_type:complete